MLVPTTRKYDLPPPPLEGENVTNVYVKLSILDTEIGFGFMKMSAEIMLTWMDPTLSIFNLRGDPLANVVDVETLHELWLPTVS